MDTLYAALGQFYFTTHSNAPPTFLQVVGWTKGAERPEAKRRYVYVRKVPLTISHGQRGGQWEFDEQIIIKYAQEITKPIHKPVPTFVNGNAIVIDGAHFLRYQSITVRLKKFDCATVQIKIPTPEVQLAPIIESPLDSDEDLIIVKPNRRRRMIIESDDDSDDC